VPQSDLFLDNFPSHPSYDFSGVRIKYERHRNWQGIRLASIRGLVNRQHVILRAKKHSLAFLPVRC
jgi:hypothetical protein